MARRESALENEILSIGLVLAGKLAYFGFMALKTKLDAKRARELREREN